MTNTLLTILTVIASSTLLASFASNWQSARHKRKEIVAGATKSALKRVEMYYRVRRRLPNGDDDVAIRDQFHALQEENDYYIAMLDMEAPWLGLSYRQFLNALKRKLRPFMSEAWSKKGGGPNVQLAGEPMPDVDSYMRRFSKDGRRLFNPFMRVIMRIRYSLRNIFGKDPYES